MPRTHGTPLQLIASIAQVKEVPQEGQVAAVLDYLKSLGLEGAREQQLVLEILCLCLISNNRMLWRAPELLCRSFELLHHSLECFGIISRVCCRFEPHLPVCCSRCRC